MKYVAIDTETTMIADRAGIIITRDEHQHVRAVDRTGRVQFTEPFVPPRLVCVSGCGPHNNGGYVMSAADGVEHVRGLLENPEMHLVFHNVAFDYLVLTHAGIQPRLFWEAAKAGRLHDTMYLDLLRGLETGYYDTPTPPDFTFPQLQSRSLDELARVYAGMELDKDPVVRCGYGQFLNAWPPPQRFIDYAANDALATKKVFEALRPAISLGERIQVCAALLVAEMDLRGVHIDRAEAERLRARFVADLPPLQEALVKARLAYWEPKPGTTTREKLPLYPGDFSPSWYLAAPGVVKRTRLFKEHMVHETAAAQFHLLQNVVRQRLETLAATLHEPAPRTDGGLIQLDAEWWKDYIPSDDEGLVAWERHEKLKKILGTYLNLYSQVDRICPRWNILGARSGRMSCSSPNVQNVPKHRHGIRSLFVPCNNDHVFVKADYAAQEVFTLAEAMAHMGIRGPLMEVLRSGEDLHYANAERLFNKPRAEISKYERQLAKVLVFGVGGGLGARKLANTARKDYGLDLTVEAAKEAKDKFLSIFWDVAEYLRRLQTDFNSDLIRVSGRGVGWWKRELGVDGGILALRKAMLCAPDKGIRGLVYAAERSLRVELPTGRVRQGCSFTEGANTYFQGLASEVTKLAGFYAMEAGLHVVLLVHDEIVIETRRETVVDAAAALCYAMKKAFAELCPEVGPYARVEAEACTRWGKATDAKGTEV